MDNTYLEWEKEWRKMMTELCNDIRRNADRVICALDILSGIDTNSRHMKFDLHVDNPQRFLPITPELARDVVLQACDKALDDLLHAAEQLRDIPIETEDDETEGGED